MKSLKIWSFLFALTASLAACPPELSHAIVTNPAINTITSLGNGSTTNYTISFDFRNNTQISVTEIDNSCTPVCQTVIPNGSGAGKFTISGGNPGTTVVMGTPPTSTQYLNIQRVIPLTQPVHYDPTTPFPSSSHETQMDQMIMDIQILAGASALNIGPAQGAQLGGVFSAGPFANEVMTGISTSGAPVFNLGILNGQSNLYTAGPQDLGSQTLAIDLPNGSTTLNKIAKLNSSAQLITTTTSDSSGAVGIVIANAGTSGSATVSQIGQALCVFDAATTQGDFVQISSSVAGDCHDVGSSAPSGGQVIGQVLSTNASAGTYALAVSAGSGGGGGVASKVQGLYDATALARSTVVFPNNQVTDLGGASAYIETGNKNLLLNPSFENTTFSSSWASSAGTFTADGTNFHDGLRSGLMTMSSQQGIVSQDVTPQIQTAGTNLEYGAWVKTSLTTVQVCARQGGSTVGTCTPVPATGTWQYVAVNYPGVSTGSVGVSVGMTASGTGAFNVDDLYVGSARNLGSGQIMEEWNQTRTFTANNLAPTALNLWSRREGDSLHIRGTIVTGTALSAPASVGMPTGLTINSGKLPSSSFGTWVGMGEDTGSSSGGVYVVGVGLAMFYDGSTTSSIFFGSTITSAAFTKINGSSLSSGGSLSVDFTVPIVGWTATGSSYVATQQDFGWIPYTPTLGSGFGTTSNVSFFYERHGRDLEVNGTFTMGTAGAALGSVPLPSGLLLDASSLSITNNTTSNPGTKIGDFVGSAAASNLGAIVTAPGTSTSMVYTAINIANAAMLTPTNVGNAMSSNGVVAIHFSVPIAGWIGTTAPALVGSVTSAGSNMFHHESLHFAGSTWNTNCGSSPCTLYGPYTAWATVTRSTTGTYSLNPVAGEFSAAPICTFTCAHGASNGDFALPSSVPSSTAYPFLTTGASTEDDWCEVSCDGPR